MSDKYLIDFFEEKARDGDSGFAIAFALLQLSNNIKEIGVYAVGTDAARCGSDVRSVFERLAMDLPEAIRDAADRISDANE